METLTTFLENGTVFIFKNCYIFMNIAMMVYNFRRFMLRNALG